MEVEEGVRGCAMDWGNETGGLGGGKERKGKGREE